MEQVLEFDRLQLFLVLVTFWINIIPIVIARSMDRVTTAAYNPAYESVLRLSEI